jgi:DNA-binding response OmpR family regulator
MRLLVVEDDCALLAALRAGLSAQGLAVDTARSVEDAWELLAINPYDLIVLDLGLPSADGLVLLRTLRERDNPIPVLILTARGELADRVAGLDAGGDDYLRKPFAFPELVARIRALLRRGTSLTPAVLRVGDLELDVAHFEVRRGHRSIVLTPKEFGILEYLMCHAGQLVTRTMLLDHCWDEGYEGLSNVVDVHVGRLRRKLDAVGGGPLLHTIRRVGFVFDERPR